VASLSPTGKSSLVQSFFKARGAGMEMEDALVNLLTNDRKSPGLDTNGR
jgi:phage tail tape-measure protein